MSEAKRNVVGVMPWLPWPLAGSAAWSQPVRAERLALLRIGVALCLLVDIALNYAPETLGYFAKGSLGDPGIFDWRFRSGRMTWSILRGVGDPTILYLGLMVWFASTFWILGNLLARLASKPTNLPRQDRTGIASYLWGFACLVYVAGLWSRSTEAGKMDDLVWVAPLTALSLACLFAVLDLGTRLRHESHRVLWPPLLFTLVMSFAMLLVGLLLARVEEIDKTVWWVRALRSWQDDDVLLIAAMALWLTSSVFLLLGCGTRLFAVMAWALSLSFQNANEYLDNAGDVIRIILLFYLMFCPCGAVWSIDSLLKRKKPAGPVYVSPWPIRLIFVQMIFIYFMNGLYKLFSQAWLDGNSLHYVMGDLALVRFPATAVPIPYELTQLMTWSVLTWEATFPLTALWKWSRRVALVCGVMFHLGIFVSMELAGFVPYALCMYLPLIPWPAEGETGRQGDKETSKSKRESAVN